MPYTFDVINATCEYKKSCQLRAASSTLTDNIDFCPAYQKQLLIQYQCVHHGNLVNKINECELNWAVPPICPQIMTQNDTKLGALGNLLHVNFNGLFNVYF